MNKLIRLFLGLAFVVSLLNANKVQAQGNYCTAAEPFCTGTVVTFPNQTGTSAEAGPSYGCLGSQPNPAWYYLKVGTTGNITIQIDQVDGSGSGIDVDFILWGPFTSPTGACTAGLTAGNTVDCNFSTAATETVHIPNAVAGQYYMLLITNYANASGVVTFQQTAGPGATDCSVVCPTLSLSSNFAGGTLPTTLACNAAAQNVIANEYPLPIGQNITPCIKVEVSPTNGLTDNSMFLYEGGTTAADQIGCFGPNSGTCANWAGTVPANTNWEVWAGYLDPSLPHYIQMCHNTSSTAGMTYTIKNCFSGATLGTGTLSPGGTGNVCGTMVTIPANTPIGTSSFTSDVPAALTYNPGPASNWGAAVFNPGIAGVGTHTVTYSFNDGAGCSGSTTWTVTVTSTNNPAWTAPAALCANGSAVSLPGQVTGTAGGMWSGTGVSGNNFNPATSGAGTFPVTYSVGSGACLATQVNNITVNAVPNVTSGTANALTCVSTTSILDGGTTTPGASLVWNGPGLTNAADPATATSAGTYTITATSAGCTNTATVSVTSNTTVPNASITPSGTTLNCSITSVTLDGNSTTPGATLAWNGPAGPIAGDPITVSSAGTYTLTVTNPANGCVTTTTQAVSSSGGNPNVAVATSSAPNLLTCNVSSISLTGSSSTGGATGVWSSPTSTAFTGTNPITITTAGDFTYTVTDGGTGCQSAQTVSITSDMVAPTAVLAAPSVINCLTTCVALTVSSTTPANANVVWSSGPGNPVNVCAAGTYTATITDPNNGCVTTYTSDVTANNTPPVATITSTSTELNCLTSSIPLVAGPTGLDFVWSGAGSGTTSSINATTPGTYTLTVTDLATGCQNTTTQAITQNTTPPNVSISPSGVILTCAVPSITLTASSTTSGVSTFDWNNSAGSQGNTNPLVVSAADTYTATVTDPANGCTSTASITISASSALPNSAVNVLSTGTEITCTNASVTIEGTTTSTGNIGTAWTGTTPPPAGNPITVSAAGTYTFTVTDITTGCTSSSTYVVNTNTAQPNISVIGTGNQLTCLITSVNATASTTTTDATLDWGAAGANPVTISTPGTYTATVTDTVNGCVNTQTFVVTSNTTQPTLTVTPNNPTLTCLTTQLNLVASTNATNNTMVWTGSVSGSGSTITVNNTGTATVDVVDTDNGCINTLSVTIAQDTTKPNVNPGVNQVLDCLGNNITLNGSSSTSGATLAWNTPTAVGVANPVSTNATGTYTLVVTNPTNGCTNSQSVTVSPNSSAPLANAGLDQTITCTVSSVNIGQATAGNNTYSWTGPGINGTNGSVSPTSVNVPGTYVLTVTDATSGCFTKDSVVVNASAVPVAAFTATPLTGLSPVTVTLVNNSTNANQYSWNIAGTPSTALTPQPTIITTIGTHTIMLIASDNGACPDTAMVTITVELPSNIAIPNVFTPNGDGNNDLFTFSTTGIKDLKADIFNRWGQKVYTITGPNQSWDGRMANGNVCSEGTYYYILKATGFDGKEYNYQGPVNLFN